MYKTEKEREADRVFYPEKVRRRNRKALQKLLEINEELENAKLRRSRYQSRKILERDEKEFFQECERRLFKLNLESDIWIDERQKVDNLCKRRDLLFDVMKNLNEQLLEAPVMKSLKLAAQQQQERLTFLNRELRRNVSVLTRQLLHQTKLFDEFTEKEREGEEMMAFQDIYFRELKQKLKTYDLVTVKQKVAVQQEEVKVEVEKNEKLVEMIKMLRHQATNVPLLKYQFLCAVDERRRLTALNAELESVVLILTDRLSDQTSWEGIYKDMEKKIKDLEQAEEEQLKKIDELKVKVKLGTKRRMSTFKLQTKKEEKMNKRLDYFKSKINYLLKEYKVFQPEIERYLGDLKPYNPLKPEISSAESLNAFRKPEKFSDDSSSDLDYEYMTDASRDSSHKYLPPLKRLMSDSKLFTDQSDDETTESSHRRRSLCPTSESMSTPDSTDCHGDESDTTSRESSRSKVRYSIARPDSEDSDNDSKYKAKTNSGQTIDKNNTKEGWWKYFY